MCDLELFVKVGNAGCGVLFLVLQSITRCRFHKIRAKMLDELSVESTIVRRRGWQSLPQLRNLRNESDSSGKLTMTSGFERSVTPGVGARV